MNFKKIYLEWLEATVLVMNSQLIRGILILGLMPLFFIWIIQNAPFLGVGMAATGIKLSILVGAVESIAGLVNFERDMDVSRLLKKLGIGDAKKIEMK